uniref:Uncharacterized protein n=1 Tax=Hucho hucho TaxID=62062 RepID=A0A4W5P8Q9_9TELE
RRTTYRGTRRRREDERITRPISLSEVKVAPPKFDLATTSFPPLPGCVASTQGEPLLENRMSDVVRGLNRDKVNTGSLCPNGVFILFYSVPHQEKKWDRVAEPSAPKVTPHRPATSGANSTGPPSTQPAVPGPKPQPSTLSSTPATPSTPASTTTTTTPAPLEPRKLSYAEVCQRAPPPGPPASTSSTPAQPLREQRVNKDKTQERERDGGWECKESRPRDRDHRDRDSRDGRYYRNNGPPRQGGSGVIKFHEQRRGPQLARRSSPQGAPRHTGKEQNIPPVSPK